MKTVLKDDYNKTIYACFIGYIVQAIINNFAPLLFLTFSGWYGLALDQIAMISTANFAVQLGVDLLSAKLLDKIGYRAGVLIAHGFAAVGLIGLAVFQCLLDFFGALRHLGAGRRCCKGQGLPGLDTAAVEQSRCTSNIHKFSPINQARTSSWLCL